MSREIKFRGRRTDTGEWVYGQYVVTPLTDENSGFLDEFSVIGNIHESPELI